MIGKAKMRAVVLDEPCAPEEMKISMGPRPEVRPGWVLIRVRAFGINH